MVWNPDTLNNVLLVCIILYNYGIADEEPKKKKKVNELKGKIYCGYYKIWNERKTDFTTRFCKFKNSSILIYLFGDI